MREQTKDLLKDNLVRINLRVQKVKRKVDLEFLEKKLIKLYFASPPKIQFALARFGMKAVLNKKKEDLNNVIRH